MPRSESSDRYPTTARAYSARGKETLIHEAFTHSRETKRPTCCCLLAFFSSTEAGGCMGKQAGTPSEQKGIGLVEGSRRTMTLTPLSHKQTIPLAQIRLDGGTQSRMTLNEAYIHEL